MGRSNDAPLIWLVLGDKLGDNAQIEIIAEALGLPTVTKRLYPLAQFVLGKPRFRPSLDHIDGARSDPLEPPWPDFVLTIGRRPSMAAMWIRQQSGGRTKIVLIGRPRSAFEEFSLIIAPAQYRVPSRANVLHLALPLMRIDAAAIAAAKAAWADRLSVLPRPLTAVLVGGRTKPFTFDPATARRLLDRIKNATAADPGTLYVTTSRRTRADVVETIETALPPHARLFKWQAEGTDNPYLGLLALADRFVVTGDSISMMVEVARLGRPLAIFDLPIERSLLGGWRDAAAAYLHGGGGAGHVGNFLHRVGIAGYSRDLGAIHRQLIDRGLAVPLGQPFPNSGAKAEDELPGVVARIRALIKACTNSED